MLLSITKRATDASAATDIGYLLHKNPERLHEASLTFGKGYVFYPEARADRCTACLLVDVDSVHLVRGARAIEDYVNDRPYVASSYMSVAMGRLFGTALAGNCQARPELLSARWPLTIVVEVIRSPRGVETFAELFAPLGYTVSATPLPLDEKFPEWGRSPYFRLELNGSVTVHDALSHLYVLLPVLDDDKHYYIGEAEVGKLLRHGDGWLATHPARDSIVSRYLGRRSALVNEALEKLLDEELPVVVDSERRTSAAAQAERELERPLTLHTQRLNQVASKLRALGVKTVLDLGCGEGKLVRRLMADREFERIVAMDMSHRSLEVAARRLRLERMPDRQRKRLELIQGSLLYRDARLAGFDGAALVEVIEHLDRPRLAALERVLFEFARPRHIVITTPNREYNAMFPTLPAGAFRHGDHRFEWTRAEFESWSNATATRFGYEVAFEPIGPEDPTHGPPSQMAVFFIGQASACAGLQSRSGAAQ